jgi:hypothetical protein
MKQACHDKKVCNSSRYLPCIKYWGQTFPLTLFLLCLASSGVQSSEPLELQEVDAAARRREAAIAQAPPKRTIVRQGNQVSVNGRTLPIPWAQWQIGASTSQVRTGISDVGLTRLTGIQLLSTSNASQQPVEWFAAPTTLPTFLTKQYRYLDVVDLAQRFGWQVQAEATTLRINSVPAKVLAVRQGRQPWGDRIVVDLDRSAPWQFDQLDGSITIDAAIDPSLIQNFQSKPGTLLQSLKLESANAPNRANQTVLRLVTPTGIPTTISTLPNPNRLIIDVRSDVAVERDILWAPGLRWQQRTITVGNDRFPVIWLTVDPRQPGVQIRPILPNPQGMQGIAPLTQTAQQAQVAAAINGGFFNRNNQLPLGVVRRDSRWLSGPILNRGAIGWNDTGETLISRLTLQETITNATGQKFPLTFLNSGFIKAGIARYTPDWGTTYTPLTDNEVVVGIQNNQVITQQPGGSAGSSAFPIPGNGYLLALRASQSQANAFSVGTKLQTESVTVPGNFNRYPQIVGAGPVLLQNRQTVLDAKAEQFSDAFIRETAARSAIARTSDGKLLITAVHNRIGGRGASLTEIAQIMQQLGAVDALNLDGGSSTTLYLGGQVIDRPPRSVARVHNGIGVFIQPTP